MTEKFRPEGWKNPYDERQLPCWRRFLRNKQGYMMLDVQYFAYEAGADAMLEALLPDRIDIVGNLHEIRLDLICKLPGCYSRIAGEHGYCQEHYERLNKVT